MPKNWGKCITFEVIAEQVVLEKLSRTCDTSQVSCQIPLRGTLKTILQTFFKLSVGLRLRLLSTIFRQKIFEYQFFSLPLHLDHRYCREQPYRISVSEGFVFSQTLIQKFVIIFFNIFKVVAFDDSLQQAFQRRINSPN